MMSPTRTLLVISLAALAASSPLRPVKRDSHTPHVVEVPSSVPELSHPDQQTHLPSHHFDHPSDKSSHQSHLNQNSHNLHPSQHFDRPSEKSSHSPRDQNEVHPEKKIRKGPKKGRNSNEDLLHHVGMTKLRSPAVNHHRKRLASQSRKTHGQKSTSDSKMFVIKLPPNPYYYAHHGLKGVDMEPQHNSVNKVPVNFNTNGKPSRVYHWNIPVLKKMVARKAGSIGKSSILADSEIFNIDKQATWNETDDEKAVYRKAVFYGPKKQSKHTFRKYFAGNGKPHSFYVMEKNKTPSSIYRLLP